MKAILHFMYVHVKSPTFITRYFNSKQVLLDTQILNFSKYFRGIFLTDFLEDSQLKIVQSQSWTIFHVKWWRVRRNATAFILTGFRKWIQFKTCFNLNKTFSVAFWTKLVAWYISEKTVTGKKNHRKFNSIIQLME